MNFDDITDKDLEYLCKLKKIVSNPKINWKEKPGHKQKDFYVHSEKDEFIFRLYTRQNTLIEDDFSCGLAVVKPDGQSLTICRYNGSGHIHGEFIFICHIHKSTEITIKSGKKPESHAEKTLKYKTLTGALYQLSID